MNFRVREFVQVLHKRMPFVSNGCQCQRNSCYSRAQWASRFLQSHPQSFNGRQGSLKPFPWSLLVRSASGVEFGTPKGKWNCSYHRDLRTDGPHLTMALDEENPEPFTTAILFYERECEARGTPRTRISILSVAIDGITTRGSAIK
jgi:hypothetical protein